tara:strand:- start:167 stop:571 length:405 start_codon:yes stop_codon:yes gene_type:complete
MKIIFRISLIVVLLSVIMISCEEDSLPGENYQDQFVGNWNVLEKTGINSPQNYVVEIVRGATQNEIFIKGLYNNPSIMVKAELFGLELDIPFQTSDGISFIGSGQANIGFDQVTINFRANDGSGEDQVNAILSR